MGIFDGNRPAECRELSRLLEACEALGLLAKQDGRYVNTPEADKYLRTDSPDTMTGYIRYSNDVLYPMWSHLEDGLNEAVRTGTCTLAGRPIWLAAFDFRFVGGTLSIVAGERLARGMEQAASSGIPYVLISASGGARMQEGALSLMQLPRTIIAVDEVKAAGLHNLNCQQQFFAGGLFCHIAANSSAKRSSD